MAFTFFYRDIHTLDMIVEQFIPYVTGRSSIKVWDAGCAMGQEPYTLAILLAESMSKYSYNNLKIYASDYDAPFEKIVKEAKYQYTELERIPEEIFAKYFRKNGTENNYILDDSVREKVTFVLHDLLTLKPIGADFSLILCKNVLLHFEYNERIEVIKMFHNSLAEGGLFASEQTQKLPPEINDLFEQIVPNAQIWRKK